MQSCYKPGYPLLPCSKGNPVLLAVRCCGRRTSCACATVLVLILCLLPFPATATITTMSQVSAADKKKVLAAVKEALEWIEENGEADADEFNDKRQEVRVFAWLARMLFVAVWACE